MDSDLKTGSGTRVEQRNIDKTQGKRDDGQMNRDLELRKLNHGHVTAVRCLRGTVASPVIEFESWSPVWCFEE